MKEICGVILAAGEGKRMRSKYPKVLHPLWGRPMVEYVLDACQALPLERILMVIGHGADRVKEALRHREVRFVLQRDQKGSGHALMQVAPPLKAFSGDLLVVCGDVPLISTEILRDLLEAHRRGGAAATVLTTKLKNPTGYGRLIRDGRGQPKGIVEEVDANARQRAIKEVNTGIYCFAAPRIFEMLREIRSSNRQGEYYLPDVFGLLRKQGEKIEASLTPEWERVAGINTREELARALQILKRAKLEELMRQGVSILDPASTFIDAAVQIGKDTVIYPHSYIEGETLIGEDCILYPGSRIVGSKMGNGVLVFDHCLILESEVADGAKIGPFAHLRPGSQIGKGARIGNFVEIKKSEIGEGSKVPHLSYIGDSTIGRGVNIGAGSITCNYDGFEKHRTRIEDGVFAGSDSLFIAPVQVGEGAIVAAGSVITEDVPPHSLAIARARQTNKEGWAKEWQERKKGTKTTATKKAR
ncbi:MAG: bifunctional UDP-N-acetylglucosamine diphosphorylase/glucosamine-1-phosphate N-acetyltransferase GlmU [candidate division NC10 bacterium]|nr:bifunctional UDP-N-acetylglucosamine diphosphorylase/glucosamine-1-phosphate N-acetyltransferase GlmU [candidate division NC10 bacterium]